MDDCQENAECSGSGLLLDIQPFWNYSNYVYSLVNTSRDNWPLERKWQYGKYYYWRCNCSYHNLHHRMDDKKREKWKVILWSRYWGAVKHNRESYSKETEVSYLEITKSTTMGEMLEYDRGIAYILMQSGMHCVGCPASIGESLEQACEVHGLDSNQVLRSIAEYFSAKKTMQ